MDKKNSKGRLIVFEGIDGTGKSTQINLLAEILTARGFEVVATREPTDGHFGKQIRQLYISRDGVSQEEELQLFIADRREHVNELINPALSEGKIVLTDRYYFSTVAYQGAAGMDPARILRLNEEFAPQPDLVLLLDIPASEGVRRIQTLRQETLNAFEQEENLEKVSTVFKSLKEHYIKTIDGTKSIDDVHSEIMLYTEQLLRNL